MKYNFLDGEIKYTRYSAGQFATHFEASITYTLRHRGSLPFLLCLLAGYANPLLIDKYFF